jgi:hypothetical protein
MVGRIYGLCAEDAGLGRFRSGVLRARVLAACSGYVSADLLSRFGSATPAHASCAAFSVVVAGRAGSRVGQVFGRGGLRSAGLWATDDLYLLYIRDKIEYSTYQ